MKFIERLKEFIDYKRISLNSFDKSIGASNGYIGKQIKNKASMGSDIIEKIISMYPDLNLTWLITGHGNMILDEKNQDTTNEPADKDSGTSSHSIMDGIDLEQHVEDLRKTITILENQLNEANENTRVFRKIVENHVSSPNATGISNQKAS